MDDSSEASTRDFFISYTTADRAWAEWIAWQLESVGHTTVLQAWDFRPGSDFMHQMQQATATATRTIAVLSPAYFGSQFGEAEWRVAFAEDPTGEQGLLIPVRVANIDVPGLLASRVYVDLVGRDAKAARQALLAGIEQRRAKPSQEPRFPGIGSDISVQAPAFPGTTDRTDTEETTEAIQNLKQSSPQASTAHEARPLQLRGLRSANRAEPARWIPGPSLTVASRRERPGRVQLAVHSRQARELYPQGRPTSPWWHPRARPTRDRPPQGLRWQLYRAVFQDELQETLRSSISRAKAEGMGLRLRLRLADTPDLAGLPWEFLYDPRRNKFLALSHHTPLVRYLELPDPPRPLRAEGPLRLLVMISSPNDYPELDVEQEWRTLTEALAPLQAAGQVVVERLDVASLAALQPRLRHGKFHVLHFIGHGGYRPDWGDGVLVMEDQIGRGRQVPGEELGLVLNEYDSMRLVVLNACEGARSDAKDPFAGVAQSLIQQGLPAVVAMQFEITDRAAIIFAHELYRAVADGYPLDAALAEARRAILNDGNPTEWATPVLYSRAPDGYLFDLSARPTPSPFIPPAAPALGTRRDQDQQYEHDTTAAMDPVVAAPLTPPPLGEPPTPVAGHPSGGWSATRRGTLQHGLAWSLVGSQFVYGVAFSPDGQLLASGSFNKRVRLWEVASGTLQRTLRHDDAVAAVAFSPDGQLLASGGDDKTARLWEVASGTLQRTLVARQS